MVAARARLEPCLSCTCQMFPSGITLINQNAGVECKEGKVVYLHRHLPALFTGLLRVSRELLETGMLPF